jgi:hypothetical protein
MPKLCRHAHDCGTRVIQPLDRSHVESVGLTPTFEDAKATLATTADAEQTVRQQIEIDDTRRGANLGVSGGLAHLRGAANQYDTEARILTHAALDHIDVSRFEDSQG